ncbi:alpha/beta fold hydrolase [Falsiroseomonas sp. E2-1-a20]|uniref:alpha/beta fold hydrolase n=1 Tax=Falsiroseomonas sp. E2-1-a20 TaxID=3239300 RepID=UPI003F2DD790
MTATSPPQIRQASIGGAPMAYWDTGGEGSPVVLLHPGTGSHAVWDLQRGVLAAAGYRVIAYSRRGHMGSPATREPGFAVDDLAALLDHLGVARAHLVGCAQGAIVALDFALSHPGRVDRMVLACTHMGLEDADHVARSAALRPPGFAAMPAAFRELGPAYRAANPQGVARWLALEHAAIPGPKVVQPCRNRLDRAALGRLAMPVLLIGGDADLWAPPPVFRDFARSIPGSRLLILSECGHAAQWEQPEAFNAAVLDFLAGSEAGDAQSTLSVTIRTAGPDDLHGMLDLLRHLNDERAISAEAAEEPWRALLESSDATVFVAEAEGGPVASCTLVIVPNLTRGGRPYALIENVVTHARHRRRGLGQRVLRAALEAAWAADCYKVMLATGSRQEATLRFYESAGFTRGGNTYFEARRRH